MDDLELRAKALFEEEHEEFRMDNPEWASKNRRKSWHWLKPIHKKAFLEVAQYQSVLRSSLGGLYERANTTRDT